MRLGSLSCLRLSSLSFWGYGRVVLNWGRLDDTWVLFDDLLECFPRLDQQVRTSRVDARYELLVLLPEVAQGHKISLQPINHIDWLYTSQISVYLVRSWSDLTDLEWPDNLCNERRVDVNLKIWRKFTCICIIYIDLFHAATALVVDGRKNRLQQNQRVPNILNSRSNVLSEGSIHLFIKFYFNYIMSLKV